MDRSDTKRAKLGLVAIAAGLVALAVMLFRVPLATLFTLGLLLLAPLLMVGLHGGSHGSGHATHAADTHGGTGGRGRAPASWQGGGRVGGRSDRTEGGLTNGSTHGTRRGST